MRKLFVSYVWVTKDKTEFKNSVVILEMGIRLEDASTIITLENSLKLQEREEGIITLLYFTPLPVPILN